MSRELIVSASGIRGVVGETLDPEVAARYGAAYGSWLRSRVRESGRAGGDTGSPDGWVLVARDSRTSGEMLADAAAAGLRAAGWDVRDAGVAPTPTALLVVQDEDEARGGLIVTASHNPVQWNGLKLSTPDGEFLPVEAGRRVQEAFRGGPGYAGWDDLGGRAPWGDAAGHHVRRILALPLVEAERVSAAGFTVALDTVRGAGGPVMSLLLEELGCRVEGLDLEPDGRFPRPPEPRPEHLDRLGELVRETGAAVGMAVDPDGDRLALVDERGEPVGEDWTLALAARHVLRRTDGPLVTNLSSSRVITDAAAEAGRRFHLAPVGEANVARVMREVGAAVGGEGNGGVMLPALHLTRDAPLAAALVLSLLAERQTSLSGLVSEGDEYHIAKRTAPRPEDPAELYRRLRERADGAPREDAQDGLRLDWPDERKWVHVRPSGTEPVLRVVAEAPTREGARELAGWALEVAEADGA